MKTIICIIGPIGSGKDTAAEYIASKLSIPTFQISQVLKDFAKELGLETTRENLIRVGNKLAEEKGQGFTVKVLMDKVSDNLLIITGVRRTGVIDYIRENYNLILLAVTSEPEIRFQRSLVRNKLGEAKTLTEFIENEQKENSAPNTERLFECMKLADCTILNDTDLKTFITKIDEFLELKELV